MIGKERRRAERSRHDSVLDILDASGRLLDGVSRLVDVSSVGACFTSTRVFVKGEVVHARLRLLRTGLLDIVGRVVRVRERKNAVLYSIEFESVRGARP